LYAGAAPRYPLPQVAGFDLEAAREKNIIHRDLKPANIMITPTGLVKILNFGLAAVAQFRSLQCGKLAISPTHAGMIFGTAAYMSPQQARGKAVDKRADIWAFGVVLYETVTLAKRVKAVHGGAELAGGIAKVGSNETSEILDSLGG
jgi:serine/threonine protein kinase